ncbi:Vps62-related protein [Candidatus Uabimicrobium sp. HlEnr_7]|uniref:Vps62-related protein n=1 Tax=Candidatus Uabimicrobium helgolandensis TaxID=3095367 RepID=UPI0035566810
MKNILWFVVLFASFIFADDISNLQRVSGKFKQVSSGKTAWSVDYKNHVYYWADKWVRVKGSFVQVATSADNTVCAISEDNRAYRWRNKKWHIMADYEVIFIAVGSKKHIWGISAQNTIIEWDPLQKLWIEHPIEVSSVSVGRDGFVWASAPNNSSFFTNGQWQRSRADFRDIIVDDMSNLWALDVENNVFRLQNGSWVQVFPPALSQLSVSNGKVWGISSCGKIYRFESPVFASESEELLQPIEQTSWSWQELNDVVDRYFPYVYMSSEDRFHPSSVEWLLDRVSLVKKQSGEEVIVAKPPHTKEEVYKIKSPQKGALYYPSIKGTEAKRGDIHTATMYVNAKRINAYQDYTDIQYWFFYPYNGSGTLVIFGEIVPVSLFGAHEGDWEHITVRVDNVTRDVQAIYFSQHGGGEWIFDLSKIKWKNGHPIVYSSKHGHASYPKIGLNKDAFLNVGLVNKTDKGPLWDATGQLKIIGTWDELQSYVSPPQWLDFPYDWGMPRLPYSKELLYKSFPTLPRWTIDLVAPVLKEMWNTIVTGGPAGPKQKGSWDGPE